MQIIDDGIIKKLVPEVGYLIYSQSTNSYHEVIYLGKNDSVNNYTEVKDENYTPESNIDVEQLINIFKDIVNE